MNWNKPTRTEILKAIDVYARLAYGDGAVPKVVRDRIDSIGNGPDDEHLFESKAFETDPAKPDGRYAIRLGNRFYPHMKLVIEPMPGGTGGAGGGGGHLFRADTHDQHIRPKPDTKEAELFGQMVDRNRALAERIEAAWEAAGVPTFKGFLRDDLARRRGQSV